MDKDGAVTEAIEPSVVAHPKEITVAWYNELVDD
jgi:hypothetical protein